MYREEADARAGGIEAHHAPSAPGHGDDVLVLRNRDIDGFLGETDQDKARHDASIALAQAAFAGS